ncbi:MAG: phytanoyl-CoA dioxygenase [Candidatus Latescibacteria bacterium]|nr:phytanoyl-CoA dioxygenase [Candidatus Latescibacterota bacterium]
MPVLTVSQLSHFEQEGYLVVRGLLDPALDLDPVIREYEEVLDKLAEELYAQGRISSTYEELPFGRRLIQICAESGSTHAQYFDFSLPQKGIKADTPFWAGPAVFQTLRNGKLLDVVEALIGPEIFSNPIQHVRLKPPEHLVPKDPKTGQVQLGSTPWHQDTGVLLPSADQSQILTVWFPLWDATIENGCLKVMPHSHEQGLLQHCRRWNGLGIPDQLLNLADGLPLPMQRGDVLFMTQMTCHGSLPNHSQEVRWSFDLRYNPIGQPTGREMFPGFVARSRKHPESELRDPAAWHQLWAETRNRMAREEDPAYNRWGVEDKVCA